VSQATGDVDGSGVDEAQLEDLLRTRGHRVTDARRAVWQALNDADGTTPHGR
jgi:Fe2+ or Zn2+ uptake regulation protein